jgi:hypothetical protein
MAIDEPAFQWDRPRHQPAFRWAWAEINEFDRVLHKDGVRVLVPLPGAEFESFDPQTDRLALYEMLARTELTEDGFLDFAHRFGRLGKGAEEHGTLLADPSAGDTASPPHEGSPPMEPFKVWIRNAAWLREALRIRGMIEANDEKGLAEVFFWYENRFYFSVFRAKGLCDALQILPSLDEAENKSGPELRKTITDFYVKDGFVLQAGAGNPIRPGEMKRPAQVWLDDLVSGRLADLASPVMLRNWKRNTAHLAVQPHSLLGAIWLQFANAIQHHKFPRTCPECGRAFEVAPGTNRSDRLTCSDSCRSKALRVRRERARQLFAGGKTIKAIAAELGSEAKTVKGWVAGQKKQMPKRQYAPNEGD